MSNSSTTSRSDHDSQSQTRTTIITGSLAPDHGQSRGYYDAEKCRAHIANQIKVSKIDRFAAQINKAQEIELEIQSRIRQVLDLFVNKSARPVQDFTSKCKTSLQSKLHGDQKHTARKQYSTSKKNRQRKPSSENRSLSEDLLNGPELRLVVDLLSGNRSKNLALNYDDDSELESGPCQTTTLHHEEWLTDQDCRFINSFEPANFVENLIGHLKSDSRRSQRILDYLCSIKHLFEKLASDHRLNVDLVYAAEEERQSATVIRRSAYNLSLAAIKATSTPVHVNSNNDHSI